MIFWAGHCQKGKQVIASCVDSCKSYEGLNKVRPQPLTTENTLTIELTDETATQELACLLAALVHEGEQLALRGDLGAGKTVFARAFIRALCGLKIEVPSPTFTLVQIYDTLDRRTIFHFDLYRLEDPDEALQLDIDDAFANGISLIEWPERLGYLLPREHLEIALDHGDEEQQRRCTISGPDSWSERLRDLSL